jgi:hypothetical protein
MFYCSLNENTLLSIIDARVQHYVRNRHYKVFNNSSKSKTSVPSSASSTIAPKLGQQQHKGSSVKITQTLYDK